MQAAGQYTKVEEDIFKALADIPDIMETTRRYVGIYWQKPDHRFEQRVFNLFRASLKTLRHIMQFFADSKYRMFNTINPRNYTLAAVSVSDH